MDATDGFEAFVAIVEAGSISAAARESRVPRETLSRQLARLEARLGARLLHRGTRRLSLTPPGELLYARARPLVLAAREATAAVRNLDETPSGLLRVSIPPGTGSAFFGPLIAGFISKYPDVSLEIFSTSRYVDLVAEGVDVALRAGTVQGSGLISRTLWNGDICAVASPGYLAQRGAPEAAEDLAEHDCLRGMSGALQHHQEWPLRDGGQVSVSGRLVSNDLGMLYVAAEAGHGITLLPRSFVEPALAKGTLVEVLPGVVGTQTVMRLVFIERRLMPAKVRAFIDHVVEGFRERGPELVDAAIAASVDGLA